MTVKRGDIFRHVLAGAGGWGDPLERDPAAVLKDVRNELLSLDEGGCRLRRDRRHRALDRRCGGDRQAPRGDAPRARLEGRAQGAMARSAHARHAAVRGSE